MRYLKVFPVPSTLRPLLIGMGLVVASAAGCSQSEKKADTSADPAAKKEADGKTASKGVSGPTGPSIPHDVTKRTSLEGRWILVFYPVTTGAEVPAALVQITKGEKDPKPRLEIREFSRALMAPSLSGSQLTDTTVRLGLQMTVQANRPQQQQQQPVREKKSADILIELRNGYARGTAEMGRGESFLVAMVPTTLESISEIPPRNLPEAADLKGTNTDAKENLLISDKFVKDHPDSPLTMEIYPYIFETAADRKFDEATINARADDYAANARKWGSRQELKARATMINALLSSDNFPQAALRQADLGLKMLNEETIPAWKPLFDGLREIAKVKRAIQLVRTGTPAEQAEAIGIVRNEHKRQAYDPGVLFEVARYDETHGQKEDALKSYAQLAVLPLFEEVLGQLWKKQNAKHPLPRESAERLWKESHGGKSEGFEKFLEQTYDESMPQFKGRAIDPRPKNAENRVVLCELFTGTGCSGCVAADVALEHLLKTYSPSEVIALQYHEHVVQPDPLANEDTVARLGFYGVTATPSFSLSGNVVTGGGFLHQSPLVYEGLKRAVETLLARKTTVQIHLKAEPKGSTVAFSAEANGSFPPDDPIRLRLVLAEDRVDVRGANGLRHHQMVVRLMPGGPRGIEPKDGKIRYEGTLDLKAVRQQLEDYLTAYEQGNKMTFPLKPLDLSHLHLVAFVQNDQSKEVYQATMIPVPGPASPDATKAKPTADAGKTQPAAVAQDGKNGASVPGAPKKP